METWGEVFNQYRARGHDASDAAYRADQWEKRQKKRQLHERWALCPSTHCERRHECASPSDCSARGNWKLVELALEALEAVQNEIALTGQTADTIETAIAALSVLKETRR